MFYLYLDKGQDIEILLNIRFSFYKIRFYWHSFSEISSLKASLNINLLYTAENKILRRTFKRSFGRVVLSVLLVTRIFPGIWHSMDKMIIDLCLHMSDISYIES